MEIPSKDICVQVYFPQVTKNAQTNCQCVSSQFIASKMQEPHSRGNTVILLILCNEGAELVAVSEVKIDITGDLLGCLVPISYRVRTGLKST